MFIESTYKARCVCLVHTSFPTLISGHSHGQRSVEEVSSCLGENITELKERPPREASLVCCSLESDDTEDDGHCDLLGEYQSSCSAALTAQVSKLKWHFVSSPIVASELCYKYP